MASTIAVAFIGSFDSVSTFAAASRPLMRFSFFGFCAFGAFAAGLLPLAGLAAPSLVGFSPRSVVSMRAMLAPVTASASLRPFGVAVWLLDFFPGVVGFFDLLMGVLLS